MSKAEKTREYIIEKSARLFNRKGYSATALSDIVEVTGLTKGSIYGNFENKDEVALAVYEYNTACMEKGQTEAMSGKESATEKLIAFTEFHRNNWKSVFEKGGCPIQNASIEADDHLKFLKKAVQNSIKSWVEGIGNVIEEGQRTGEFKKSLNAQEYAYSIIIILEGGIMLAKIMNKQQLLFMALDRIVTMIHKELKM